ncbi:hypothetical protein Tco_1093247 [Tanacetum coccineum]|uniref:Reverse transcriptase Ty1/copia-type domain-containing protein n=1 Tax=Tanacetum coccineum TaxID=301880 RepID=A0ABQ5IDF2_9ASTR
MDNCHSIGTPLATKPKLDVDLSGEPVDQSDYRSKIGSLIYLTSSRPDLVQAVCYCARYQARPTQKHLKEHFSDVIMLGCLEYSESTSGGNTDPCCAQVNVDEDTAFKVYASTTTNTVVLDS